MELTEIYRFPGMPAAIGTGLFKLIQNHQDKTLPEQTQELIF